MTMAATELAHEPLGPKKKPMGFVARAIIAYLLLELGAFAGLHILDSSLGVRFAPVSTSELSPAANASLDSFLDGTSPYLQHDPALGWSIRSGGESDLYRANSIGIRASRQSSMRAAPGVVRIATYGGSSTHGDGVVNERTWQAQLESALTRVEVLNFGVPMYGLDQSYLRFMEDGRDFRANVIMIGIAAGDVFQGLNVWRPYHLDKDDFSLTKPRFRLTEGGLVLVPNPLPNLKAARELRDDPASLLPGIARTDSLFGMQYAASAFDVFPSIRLGKMLNRERKLADLSPLDERGHLKPAHEGFEVLRETLRGFVDAAREDRANVMVLLFPDGNPAGESNSRPYQPLADWLGAADIEYIDLQDAFDLNRTEASAESLRLGTSDQYSPRANDIIAQAVRKKLTELGWALP